MNFMADFEKYKNILNPHKQADKRFYLDLLDEDTQREWEDAHLSAVLFMHKALYISTLTKKIKPA